MKSQILLIGKVTEMHNKNILVIEDDPIFIKLISHALEQHSFNVLRVTNGMNALDCLSKNNKIEAVILDLFLPDINGLEILKKIRTHPVYAEIPIIILTSNDDKLDAIITIEMGADDYITKPFHKRELIARLNAIMRRTKAALPLNTTIISICDIQLNTQGREVRRNGSEISLTFAEYELLLFLMVNAGNVFSRDRLLTEIWGESYITETRVIDMHISSLRKKLGDENNQFIETVRRVGYRFRKDVDIHRKF